MVYDIWCLNRLIASPSTKRVNVTLSAEPNSPCRFSWKDSDEEQEEEEEEDYFRERSIIPWLIICQECDITAAHSPTTQDA